MTPADLDALRRVIAEELDRRGVGRTMVHPSATARPKEGDETWVAPKESPESLVPANGGGSSPLVMTPKERGRRLVRTLRVPLPANLRYARSHDDQENRAATQTPRQAQGHRPGPHHERLQGRFATGSRRCRGRTAQQKRLLRGGRPALSEVPIPSQIIFIALHISHDINTSPLAIHAGRSAKRRTGGTPAEVCHGS